jgi:nitrate reductase gamma subunit
MVVLPELAEGVAPDDPQLAQVVRNVDCLRCHSSASPVPAPEAELPPRSVLCLPCHDGAPVVRDGLSWVGLGVFGVGMAATASIWLQGSVRGRHGLSLPARLWGIVVALLDLITTPRLFVLLWAFVVDGLLHRRLFRRSKARWLAHTLMYLGMTARTGLAVFTWLMTLAAPMTPLTQALVNRSSPPVALVYDTLGLLVIVGAAMAVVRRYVVRDDQLITAGQDTIAVILLGSIFVMGFGVEGVRILTTDLRSGLAAFSFVGWGVSAALRWVGADWGAVYPWLWYAHAGLVAALVAYLPFSKFIHVLIGPVVAAVNAARNTEMV